MCLLLSLFSFIKLSIFHLLFKNFHFSFSSIFSTSPTDFTSGNTIDLLLVLSYKPAARGSKPTNSSSFRRAKLLSEPLRAGSGVGCVHSAGAESQHPSGGHTWAAEALPNGRKDIQFET